MRRTLGAALASIALLATVGCTPTDDTPPGGVPASPVPGDPAGGLDPLDETRDEDTP